MIAIRRAATAAGVALVLALAGCGGGGLSKAELADKANDICRKYAKQGDSLKTPDDVADPKQAKAFFDRASDISDRQQAELEDLEPADAVKGDWDAMVAATKRATTLLSDLADAAGQGDQGKGTELITRLQPASDDVDRTARRIGATSCAS